MELVLTRQAGMQVSVTCDTQPSHDFDLTSLIPDDTQPNRPPQPLENPIAYGQAVFQALFAADAPARRGLEAGVDRILLVAGDELQAVPWEYAHTGENFLVAEIHFVRGLSADKRIQPPSLDGGLHIVAVPSDPLDENVPPLNIDGEWLRLTEIVSEIDAAVRLERTRPATIERLAEHLAGQAGRVVHFMGHGGQGEKVTALFFEQENGAPQPILAREFVRQVKRGTYLVMLNACVSASPGATEFDNIAAALVSEKIPYALGMRFSIADDDARDFSRVFYGQLARGVAVEDALHKARLKLARSPRGWAVGVPVLYTALNAPGPGFSRVDGQPRIAEGQPPMEVSVIPRAEGVFQGRIDALVTIGTALTGDSRPRVLTIHGLGGQGKTALAREAVERFGWAFPGGVYAAYLETLPTREIFVNGLAGFLGINTDPSIEPAAIEQAMLTRLKQKRTLIVLDNAETLKQAIRLGDPAALRLAGFLREDLNGTRAHLLVTSRDVLEWPGEEVLDLSGLKAEDGAALFVESAPTRAKGVETPLAQELSRRVEGHPLSLRLLGAAFNSTQMPLMDFVAEHEEQLVRAENKYKGDDHRHRKLYAAIDTSARHLPEGLKALLSGLWVFHAPFLPEIAETIFDPDTEYPEGQRPPVHDQLYQLWQRGLLERSVKTLRDGNVLMYRLLPTVRPYTEHYLTQAQEGGALLKRFGNAYARLVRLIYGELDRSAGMVYIAQQAQEDLTRGQGQVDPGTEEQGYYLLRWGWVLGRLGDRRQGSQLLEAAKEMAEGRSQRLELEVLNNMALVYSDTGQPGRALALYEEALPIMREVGDRAGEAATLNNLAAHYFQQGNAQSALELLRQVIQIYHGIGAVAAEAAILLNTAVVLHQSLGQPSEAIELVSQSLEILRQYNLSQDASGVTIAQHEDFLAQMRSGSAPSSLSTLPTERIRVIVANTVAVMTTIKEKFGEWHTAIESSLQKAREQGADWQIEVEFYTAVLVVLDGQQPGLPPDHPYADALAQIQSGIAAGGLPEQEKSVESQSEQEQIAGLIVQFVQAEDWKATRHFLETNQTLLFKPEAETIFEAFIEQFKQQDNGRVADLLQAHLAILRESKAQGIAATFERLLAAQEQSEASDSVIPADFIAQCVKGLKGTPDDKSVTFIYLQQFTANSGLQALIQLVQRALFMSDPSTLDASALTGLYAEAWQQIVHEVKGA